MMVGDPSTAKSQLLRSVLNTVSTGRIISLGIPFIKLFSCGEHEMNINIPGPLAIVHIRHLWPSIHLGVAQVALGSQRLLQLTRQVL